MGKKLWLCGLAALLWAGVSAQQTDSSATGVFNLPSKFLSAIGSRTRDLNETLTNQTQRYLERMQRREERMRQRLYKTDSNAAKALFNHAAQQYTSLSGKIATDTGSAHIATSGVYQPYVDSMSGVLHYLQQAKNLSPLQQQQLAQATTQFQALQAKFQDAGEVQAFIQQRKQQLSDYIQQHTSLSGLLGKDYQGMNQDVYYYAQQLRQYKEAFNDPDKLEQQALGLLEKLPAFQSFLQQHSQLAGLFGIPANYGTPQGLVGLQTRDQIASMIQGQVSAAGPGGAAALQSSLQSGESQLDAYKDKLSQLGAGSDDMQMPDFQPNPMKTKTFWKRLQYGANFQTTRNSYLFPTVADFGAQVGFRLSGNNVVGLGASYKLGLGNGFQHIAFSNEGVGLRSFVNVKIKGSFGLSGGYEMNYTTPFSAYQDLYNQSNWTKSGLIGVMKTVAVKNRFFKQTSLQLLWDFLSYQQVPRTQPILFRVGYTF